MDPAAVLDADEIALGDPAFWLRAHEEREGAFQTLRREAPVAFHEEPAVPEGMPFPRGTGFWSVVKHADILHVSRNPEIFQSGKGSNIGDLPPPFLQAFGSMINMDDPSHARLRRIVSRGFTPKMVARAEANVAHVTRQIIDNVIEKGECDFVTDIAARLPLAIICQMMGIPESQYDFVFEKSTVILGAGDPEYVAERGQIVPALLGAGAELTQLAQDLGAHRQQHPTDDLTSALVNAEVDGEKLDTHELGSFFVLLAVAGNETTRNAISHGMKALSDHPEQRAIWQRDFRRVSPSAVEEIVRWATPVIHFRRTATRDTEIRGQKIEAGQKVVMWYAAANRDEEVFEDPQHFDVRRTPNEHVGFGGPGPHFCMGAHLARREMTVMFEELFRRLPDIEVVGEPDYLQSFFIHGIKHIRVQFTPGERSAGDAAERLA